MIDLNHIHTVGVVGAGTMGLGIARTCAAAGYNTFLFDTAEHQLSVAITTLRKDLEATVGKGKMTRPVADGILERIIPCHSLDEMKADVIVEAIIEKLDVKQSLFLSLEKVNKPDTILATNTSSLSVSAIGAVLEHPSRFVGLHFFNPAHLMKLVEIIAGSQTGSGTVALMKAFSEKLGKTVALAKDSPGFIVNRVARHYYLESLCLLEENVADVKGIDSLLRSAGFKMGPFELMDLIGIDINYFVTTSVYKAMGEPPKFRPSKIQEEKVAAGHLGRKTGKGFYDYEKN